MRGFFSFGELLYLSFGEECVDEGLDEVLVLLVQLFDCLELFQEFPVSELSCGDLFPSAVHQVIGGGAEASASLCSTSEEGTDPNLKAKCNSSANRKSGERVYGQQFIKNTIKQAKSRKCYN